MAEYIYALTGAVLVSELFMMLMPEGKLRRFARTAVGLLLMLMILLPLKECSAREFSFGVEKPQGNAHKNLLQRHNYGYIYRCNGKARRRLGWIKKY